MKVYVRQVRNEIGLSEELPPVVVVVNAMFIITVFGVLTNFI